MNPYLCETLPNMVIHASKNITGKMNVLKMCGPQIRLCLFTFRPIASKQLNSLTTIDSLSCLGVAEVGLSLIRPVLSTESPGINTLYLTNNHI